MARLGAALLLCATGLGCTSSRGAQQSAWLDDPSAPLPQTLSAVGLYPDVTDPRTVDERAIAYSPSYPLWSNGSDKRRYLVLPEGTQVDTADARFSLPVGAVLFKTFAFADDRAAGGLRYAETRVLQRTADGVRYGSYAFRQDGSDADLLDGKRATKVAVQGPDGEDFEHEIPSTRQCRTCHESAPDAVLGFIPAQLRDGQLAALHEAGVLSDALDEPEPLDDDAQTAAVLGYVLGNCVHCHNGFAQGENSSFDLRPEVMLEHTVGKETESSASGIGIRIVPGAPRQSVLYLAFIGEDNGTGIKPMPPLGVQRRDQAAAERLRAFIEGLPSEEE